MKFKGFALGLLTTAMMASAPLAAQTGDARQVVTSEEVPLPVGPYSPAIVVDNFLFTSGQIGLVPGTKEFAGADIASQTEQALENIEAIFRAAGVDWSKVVRVEIYLQDMGDFKTVNGIYAARLAENIKPVRQTVEVARLPLDALIEISCIAVK